MNMCAEIAGTPSDVSAGATTIAQMMYDPVIGTARPTIHTASAANSAVNNRSLPASETTIPLSFKPRPVSVMTPMIIPAQAQIAAIAMVFSIPAASARWTSCADGRFFDADTHRRMAVAMEKTADRLR